jgi:hypothetical protein
LDSVDFGVPQGSVLGPTLFLIYINDIHNLDLPEAEIICYADDTVILFHGDSWGSTYAAAEKGMSSSASWFRDNLLTLNSIKTKFVCFHKSAASSPTNSTQPIKIHTCNDDSNTHCSCEIICRTQTIKYLGLLIDENLNFKAHITGLSKRIRKMMYIFKNLRHSADPTLLKNIYISLCQSLITYAISSWGSAAKTTVLVAERAQRSVLKVMLKKPYRYPTNILYSEAQVLTVRQLFIHKICLSMHKCAAKMENYPELLSKRVFKLPIPRVNTAFGRRFGDVISSRIYNTAVHQQNRLIRRTVSEAKRLLFKWLLSLDYQETEALL